MQIFEGTNQIQRMVIGRALDVDNSGAITHAGDNG
jgi:alkylation response protein AidB-like acyl-CoA dehydrogenase